MKDLKYCPLCGSEFQVDTGDSDAIIQCNWCEAREYRFGNIPLGYLYPEEYERFLILRNALVFLLVMAMAFVAIAYWFFVFPIFPR